MTKYSARLDAPSSTYAAACPRDRANVVKRVALLIVTLALAGCGGAAEPTTTTAPTTTAAQAQRVAAEQAYTACSEEHRSLVPCLSQAREAAGEEAYLECSEEHRSGAYCTRLRREDEAAFAKVNGR
jgi:hypothetical protein